MKEIPAADGLALRHTYNLERNVSVLTELMDYNDVSDILLRGDVISQAIVDLIEEEADGNVDRNRKLLEMLVKLSTSQFEYAIEYLRREGRHKVARLLTSKCNLENIL